MVYFFFFYNDPATTEISPLPLHDALPIWERGACGNTGCRFKKIPSLDHLRCRSNDLVIRLARTAGRSRRPIITTSARSEEHTSELQSQSNIVCRLLLEKKIYDNCLLKLIR